MADGKPRVTVADIHCVVDQIVERFHPSKIWLFGSFAYGTPTPDSDVDLLIAMDTSLRNVQQAVEIRKAVAFPFPVDLMWLYSSGHMETRTSYSIRGVFDESTHDEKVSRRV